MNTRNDFLHALEGRPCARVPFQEPEVSPAHVDAALGRRLGLASVSLAPADYVEFTLATGQSALHFNALWKAGRIYRADSTGRPQYVGGCVQSRADFARIEPFDVQAAGERVAALKAAAAPHGLAVVLAFSSPFRLALYAMGYENFFMRLHDEPEFVQDLIRHFEEPATAHLEALLRQGADALLVGGSICAGSGPMLSNTALRARWLPAMRAFLQPATARNLPVILHMDGDFSTIADLLLELPIAALHPFEVTGRLDIRRFRERYGPRVAIWGNIDLAGALTRGTPAEVREDVRQHLARLAPGGRYILGSSHEITADVPVANFQALVAAARELSAPAAASSA